VLKLTLRCPHDEARCSGSVTLTAKGQRVGSAKFRVAGGKTTVVSVKLSRKVLSLAKGGRLRLSVAVTAADASGNTGATTRKLALKVGQRR
jgi:hypothetical protein